jgi:hypothetical protein
MNPEEDPEARIRQLENSAAQYGAVELGAGQSGHEGPAPTAPLPPPVYGSPPAYGSPPPYGAPPAHGDPYAAPFGVSYAQGPSKGAPMGLIFGLIAVVVLIIFGTVGVIVWSAMSRVETVMTEPEGSDVAGGGGTVVDEPSGVWPTDIIPSGIPGLPDDEEVVTAAPGAPLSVAGVDEVKTVACNENAVNVSGVNNNITITGHCVSVSVSGVENVVVVDSAETIGASGFDNRVIYRSGAPLINATGSNVVAQG